MTDRKLSIGQVVRLKSGGPKMTVVYFNGPDRLFSWQEVRCSYFDSRGEKQDWLGPESALEPVSA